jgi:hypothetical protein
MGDFALSLDYIDVATRIVEFRTKFPGGSLQQVDLQFVDFGAKSWVVYTAAAYRTPDDERPGHGTAWEPVPGKTNFTRDSELQNAETAAWGRAIVAALAADTKKGVASAEEVRNRQSPNEAPPNPIVEARLTVREAWLLHHQTFDPTEVANAYEQERAAPFADASPDDLLSFARALSLPPEPSEQLELHPDEV